VPYYAPPIIPAGYPGIAGPFGTPTRFADVTYTNGALWRYIVISWLDNTGGGTQAQFTCGGATMNGVDNSGFTNGVKDWTFLIPPGATYRLSTITGTIGFNIWFESA
jgi:hypothetical protein